jgi:hypothetical protein
MTSKCIHSHAQKRGRGRSDCTRLGERRGRMRKRSLKVAGLEAASERARDTSEEKKLVRRGDADRRKI